MVTCEIHDSIAVVKMDDGKANALNKTFLTALSSALDEALAGSAKAVALFGRPGFFSGGLDLKSLPTLPQDELKEVLAGFFAVALRLLDFPVPVVAGVTGHSMAGGVVLSLGCDAVIAARGPFKTGLNEVPIGIELPPFVVELARSKVNPQYLFRVTAHGEVFSMDEAAKAGLVDEVVEPAELESTVLKKARALSALPNGSYLETKRYLRKNLTSFSPESVIAPVRNFFKDHKK